MLHCAVGNMTYSDVLKEHSNFLLDILGPINLDKEGPTLLQKVRVWQIFHYTA